MWTLTLPALLRRAARPGPPRRLAKHLPTPPVAEGADEPCLECGWFNSSHELRQGLLVIEPGHRAGSEPQAG